MIQQQNSHSFLSFWFVISNRFQNNVRKQCCGNVGGYLLAPVKRFQITKTVIVLYDSLVYCFSESTDHLTYLCLNVVCSKMVWSPVAFYSCCHRNRQTAKCWDNGTNRRACTKQVKRQATTGMNYARVLCKQSILMLMLIAKANMADASNS